VVSVPVAFDGWPVELFDTAGLREAEGLEAEGVERAKRALGDANLVIWVVDATDREGSWPKPGECERYDSIFVTNKIDLPHSWDTTEWNRINQMIGGVSVSATVGTGIAELIAAILKRLVPDPPPPGSAVPYTPGLADRVTGALAVLDMGCVEDAGEILRACIDMTR
jgi:tRNA modification GTPase